MSEPPDRAPLAWPVAACAVLVLVVALVGLGALFTRRDSSPATGRRFDEFPQTIEQIQRRDLPVEQIQAILVD
jgi:hypothetical protein